MQTLRIDLTDYRVYIEAMRDNLNEDGAYTMSMTDAQYRIYCPMLK